MDIGVMITTLRKEFNLTQKDLSDYLNLSTGTISNYENGVHYPDLITLDKLADLFQVTTDYLLGRTNFRCPPELLDKYRTADGNVCDLANRFLKMDNQTRHSVQQYMDYVATNTQKPET